MSLTKASFNGNPDGAARKTYARLASRCANEPDVKRVLASLKARADELELVDQ
jgi:hypothetical protein